MQIDDKQRLESIFYRLNQDSRSSLLDYAKFLSERQSMVPPQQMIKKNIPRPADESIIAAVKRLKQTYPMLDGYQLLNQTSLYLSEYFLQGRGKKIVIDKLEQYFAQEYNAATTKNDI